MKPKLAGLIACLNLLTAGAYAQPGDLFELSLDQLLQVHITATKREQPWGEIAATVDVYERDSLRKQQTNHLRELAQITPGLVYGRVGNTPNIYLRGIGSDLLSVAADASTAIYQDDAYLARPEMGLAHFWDVERIEILKGPQGALYGRNATGGAINIINARPILNQYQGYLNLTAGNFASRKMEAALNNPLGENSALRTSLLLINNDGYTQDLDDRGGTHLDDDQVVAARTMWHWALSENLYSSLSASHYQNNNNGFSLTPADNLGLADLGGALPTPGFHQIRNNQASFSKYQTQGLNWQLHWQGENLALTSISAYHNLDSRYLLNTDGTEIAITDSQLNLTQQQRSQEIRLVSTNASNWQWLLGASWQEETPNLDVGLVRYPLDTSIVINSFAKTRAWGVYGEVAWNFSPQWNIKLGLRNTHEERRDGNQFFNTGDLLGLDSNMQMAQATGASNHSASFDKFSPQLVLSFSPELTSAQDLIYVSVTEGFKSGGSNSFSTRPGFKPEEITSIEAGYKYTRGKVALSLAGFQYDYSDLQVITYEAGSTTITNAASANIKGVDCSLRWEPQAQWRYQMGFSFLDANYQTFITSLAGAPKDVSGHQMPFAPGWDINQSLSYSPAQSWQISLDHHYQSLTYYNQFEDRIISTPSLHLFNLRALKQISQHWDLAASIYNLNNKNYYQNLTRFTSTSPSNIPQGNALGVTAPGRSWNIEAHFYF